MPSKSVEVLPGWMLVTRNPVPGMLSRGRGHVVAISSDAGRKVFPGLGVYSASNFLTASVSVDMPSKSVEVLPGWMLVTRNPAPAVSTGMLSRGRGHVVAISSDAGRKVFPGLGVYSASKFGIRRHAQQICGSVAGLDARHAQPSACSLEAEGLVFPGLGVYSASKFFVEATLQALRLETAGAGLRVG
jgi:NADP-dependent 3-hydroxy acid dehydrogenase YdfG